MSSPLITFVKPFEMLQPPLITNYFFYLYLVWLRECLSNGCHCPTASSQDHYPLKYDRYICISFLYSLITIMWLFNLGYNFVSPFICFEWSVWLLGTRRVLNYFLLNLHRATHLAVVAKMGKTKWEIAFRKIGVRGNKYL